MRVMPALLAICGSAVVVFVTTVAPPHLLLYAAHRAPRWLEADIALAAFKLVLVAGVLVALRLLLGPSGTPRPVAGGVRAAGWFVGTTCLFSLLVTFGLFTFQPAGVGTEAEALIAAWRRQFPVTGVAGRIAVLVVVLPLVEELVFRGVVIGRLMNKAPAGLALAVSTALFAPGHASWVLAGLTGLGFGLLYLRYRRIWICVLAHGGHNLLATFGMPLLAASLRDAGFSLDAGDWRLLIQLSWFVLVIACATRFLQHVFGRIEGGPSSLLRRPVGAAADAPT